MLKTKINIKKLYKDAKIPCYATEFSAGADIYAYCDLPTTIAPLETAFIKTGLCIEIPCGYVGLIYARSGLASKKGLAPANKVGVIDSDYRGEIIVPLYNHSHTTAIITKGERIAQMVITPYLTAQYVEIDSLSETVRAEGGFGSTGK